AAEWRDEPERHHSMRAVFDATWGMLSEDERAVFARLSVFRGGFMREAAEAVAGTDLRTLISLVSKSLLQRDRSGRYEIHELLWQYAESRLEEVPEEKENTLDLHAAFCAEFLAREEMDIWRGYMGASLREIDNIRAAWRRMTAHGHVAEIRKCLFSLFGLYQGPGLLQEGEDVFARAVEALRPRPGEELDEGQAAALGLALGLQGRSCRMVGRIDSARPLAQESLSVLSKLGERREVAFAYVLGDPTLDLAGYIRSLEKSLKISSKRAYYPVMSVALTSLMFGAFMRGQDREVERYAQQQLALDKRFGGRWSAAFAHTWLGHVAFAREDYVQARRCYREGLALFRQVGQIWAVGRLYSHLGDVAMAVSDYGEAKACHQRALARCQEVGVYWLAEGTAVGGAWGVPVSHQRLGDVALAQGDLAEAERCYGLALEAASDRPEGGLKPHVLLGPAALLARTGEMQRAAELAVLARHHPASVEETRTKAEELLDRLRSELSPEAYTAAETRGRARDLEATLHELLGKLHAWQGRQGSADRQRGRKPVQR
ncbi:MAG: hypothetical protein AB8I80_01220, partial [Anaerolineae bacterium]